VDALTKDRSISESTPGTLTSADPQPANYPITPMIRSS
jgi:hypothetical protein